MKFTLGFCLIAAVLVLGELTSAEQICEPESVFKEDCNTCRCSADGTEKACTRIVCVPGAELARERRDTQPCVPGTVFKIECNDCVCSEAGMPICTLKACIDD
ncbi:UNVERIFIED_CONTAM: hypothetical protein PYX00_002201 [Menopon gallinae]|uniref:Protease inhibitor n=1 Tax=Menopon gallinae TaxID=328185 RepID=A0AAW2IFR6_9NEOP